MSTITYTSSLTVLGCSRCHIDFGVPASFHRARKEDAGNIWCPACGHKMSYGGQSDNEKLRSQLQNVQAQFVHEQDQRIAAERRVTAYKGTVTRMKKRTAAGVCPCCQRTFQQLARHMAGQHPEYAGSAS